MEYKKIKNTELLASRIVLGTDRFGTECPKEQAFALMDTYVELGGNMLDTARIYGAWAPGGDGASERVVGEYIKSRGLENRILVSSKGAHPPLENMAQSRLSRAELEYDVDTGLKMLGMDRIDLFWLHRDDESLPVEPIIDVLDELVTKGKIRCYGASNWRGKRLQQANEYAAKSGKQPFVASQIQWSIAWCDNADQPTLVQMDEEEASYYNQSALPVFAYSSQSKGFFEKYDQNALTPKVADRYLSEENITKYQRLKKMSVETGYPMAALSLAYLLCTASFDVFPIIGASATQQIKDSLQVMEMKEFPALLKAWRNGR